MTTYGLWTASSDEERWPASRDYASREEAIQKAPLDLDLEPGQKFWVGRTRQPAPPILSRFAEHLGDMMYEDEDGGEFSEGWPECSDDEAKELDELLNTVIFSWVKKHDLMPTWFIPDEVTEHLAPEIPQP